jgi:hypothetical protein
VVTYNTKVLIPIKLVLKKMQEFLPLTGVRYITMVLIPPCGVLAHLSGVKPTS